ncbi:efflux RND transporter periplasmic adaptor subunit [Salinimicrobium sp. GXAS 041]|uniref:efflux RND transporter periplasmic adaptor subunit n=1 Tax=Salinimicrobium sp. GXAS 041 TaxID=3400806 RepID=UPI003C7104F9
MSTKKIVWICIGILVIAGTITALIFMTEPTAQSESATRQTAMLVNVEQVKSGNYRPTIVANGTVQPVEDVMLSAQVGGQVVRRASGFVPGGFVQKGDVLLQIDPSDYRNTLELRRSELLQAQTDLDMEMGRQTVAEQDLALVGGDTLSEQNKSLVLRQPQLEAAKGMVRAAEAAVRQAEINLARTTVRAPFDAHVLLQNVTVGSQVSPGDDLGRLVGTNSYWAILTLPVSKLQWLTFPKNGEEQGTEVKIRNNSAWPQNTFRQGYLDSRVGALDEQTRLARIVVRLPDPLAQEDEDKPELMIGTFVEGHIPAREVKEVVRLNRDYVRSNNTVWVMEEGKLSIRDVEILLTDTNYAYINTGLEDGDQVITTNLSTVTNGIALRTGSASQSKEETAPANREQENHE